MCEPVIFGGSSARNLCAKICRILKLAPGVARWQRFSDGELFVEIGQTVRGKSTYIIQSTSAPVNENLMELLIMVDALKRASAERITAVIPYYGYSRQDKKERPRSPITAKLIADLLTVSGCSRITSVDLHAGQIQGFFDIPVDHLFSAPVFVEHIQNRFPSSAVVVSPDAGGVERARLIAERLKMNLAITDRGRGRFEEQRLPKIIGDVQDRTAVLIDDMVDTGSTLLHVSQGLARRGARSVHAYCTHPVFSGPVLERIMDSPIEQLVVTDSIPLSEEARACPKITVLSLAELLAEAIRRIHNNDSVSSLFYS